MCQELITKTQLRVDTAFLGELNSSYNTRKGALRLNKILFTIIFPYTISSSLKFDYRF